MDTNKNHYTHLQFLSFFPGEKKEEGDKADTPFQTPITAFQTRGRPSQIKSTPFETPGVPFQNPGRTSKIPGQAAEAAGTVL